MGDQATDAALQTTIEAIWSGLPAEVCGMIAAKSTGLDPEYRRDRWT